MKRILLLSIGLSPIALFAQSQQCQQLQGAILRGAHVITTIGTAGSPVWAPFTGPVAAMGRIVFDGLGNLQMTTSTIVASNPPLSVRGATFGGSYTVNGDCTGTMTFNFAQAPNGHYDIVMSPDGRQLTLIATDKGDVLTGTAVRLDHNP